MADSAVPEGSTFISGPDFHIDLAAIDALHPVHYGRRLLIFRCTSTEQRTAQIDALKSGLQALVQNCPILGGTVVPQPSPDESGSQPTRSAIVPARGLELVIRDLHTALPTFSELEADDFQPALLPYDLLVPVPRDVGKDRPFAACMLQYSAIDGGTILTWAISHTASDGSGNNELARMLSEHVRAAERVAGGAQPSDESSRVQHTIVGLDRSALRSITSDAPFEIEDHPGYSKPPVKETLADEVSPQAFRSSQPQVPILLRISPAGLSRLKTDAAKESSIQLSTHDALVGLIWRSILLIRSRRTELAVELAPSTKAALFFPSDARKHLGLPPSHIGNSVYQLAVAGELNRLLPPDGLQHAAIAIRRAIAAVTPDLAASYFAEVNKRWVDWAWATAGTLSTTGVAMGTNWTSGAMYQDDWGEAFGRMVRFRYPGEAGLVAVLPKLPDGSAEIIVSVMPEEVETLESEECFGKYMNG